VNKLTPFNTKLVLVAIAAVALVAAAILYFAGSGGPAAPRPGVGDAVSGLAVWDEARPLAEVAFTDADGGEVRLDSFQGKVVLLNFWATWCVPCVTEMPALARLQAKIGGGDFTVVAVSGDAEGQEAVDAFLADIGLSGLTILYDPKLLAARKLGVRGLPTSILIGRGGAELGRAEGPLEWDSPEIVDRLSGLIDGAVQPAAGGDFTPPAP
jgi:thiol-disulfide isomerase/thioredoxin